MQFITKIQNHSQIKFQAFFRLSRKTQKTLQISTQKEKQKFKRKGEREREKKKKKNLQHRRDLYLARGEVLSFFLLLFRFLFRTRNLPTNLADSFSTFSSSSSNSNTLNFRLERVMTLSRGAFSYVSFL